MKMIIYISNRRRGILVGILILLAQSMLTYSITKNIALGSVTDIVSGLAVIVIPLLMLPVFNNRDNKLLNYGYLIDRFIEGSWMIIGGLVILSSSLVGYRETMYKDIQIYFFISGALFFIFCFTAHKLSQDLFLFGAFLRH